MTTAMVAGDVEEALRCFKQAGIAIEYGPADEPVIQDETEYYDSVSMSERWEGVEPQPHVAADGGYAEKSAA